MVAAAVRIQSHERGRRSRQSRRNGSARGPAARSPRRLAARQSALASASGAAALREQLAANEQKRQALFAQQAEKRAAAVRALGGTAADPIHRTHAYPSAEPLPPRGEEAAEPAMALARHGAEPARGGVGALAEALAEQSAARRELAEQAAADVVIGRARNGTSAPTVSEHHGCSGLTTL